MTDEEVGRYEPTLARLACAVQDRSTDEVHEILCSIGVEDRDALLVLACNNLPPGIRLGAKYLPLPDYGDAQWTPEQIEAAHSIYEYGQQPRIVIGEQKWRQLNGWKASA